MVIFAAEDNGETSVYTAQLTYVSGYSEMLKFEITPTIPVITAGTNSIAIENVESADYYMDWVRCAPGV